MIIVTTRVRTLEAAAAPTAMAAVFSDALCPCEISGKNTFRVSFENWHEII